MKLKLYAAVAALFLAPSITFAQDVNKLVDKADVERIIKTLSADDMQGRGTFTPGIDKAATFIEGEFKAAGLQPLKGSKGFRQSFSKTRVTPTDLKVTFDGTALPAESIAASTGTSFNWKGDTSIAVVNITDEKNFRSQYSGVMRSGKKSLVVMNPSMAAIFKRIRDRAIKGGIVNNPAEQAPVVYVLSATAPKTFEVSCGVKSEELPLFNVVGMIPGKSKAAEYVVFSGHYDHLGIIKPMEGDSIANGADDDASGTTAVIALAKYYKKLKNNERTLIFVAFTAEEIGGYGSQYFSKQLDADKVVAMFNIEMIGKDSKFGPNTAFITGFERSNFGSILQKNVEGTEFKFHPDPYPEQDLFYRSDNATLARLGVPAHSISTDQIDTDKLYHSVNDEFESLDVNNIVATIKAIALGSRSIVSGKDTPTRVAKLER
ncbi:M20/M25/M40 family metallo-hydrolase [Mucilaginibacter pallidiroseus]|uniref:M20/M25/M40 family metallo-hydrolase n=1 Tax=Mucilaginibacter pallidiroseus TaxID=2599295 RepID=A0A563UEH4_9SPHI|nr:M20/M25/M40 family metallo-hydrolase [Mucilaginibacter pallidiroseus]TWR29761.1 M20/M25/M40 family metallo-hydrolase [Mucilaginibacter pallidiroseus]